MKKYILLACIGAFTHVLNAQNTGSIVASANDTNVTENVNIAEARLIKQEQEVQALKRDNEAIKKEIKQLKSALSIGSKNKVTISRKGSKQVIID